MRMIVAKDKWQTQYLDASTDEAFAKSALALLTERYNEGFWGYKPEEPDADEYAAAATTDEQIDALPAAVREQMKRTRAYSQRMVEEFEDGQEAYLEMKRIVEAQSLETKEYARSGHFYPVAWSLLEARADYEYEHVSLETVKSF